MTNQSTPEDIVLGQGIIFRNIVERRGPMTFTEHLRAEIEIVVERVSDHLLDSVLITMIAWGR